MAVRMRRMRMKMKKLICVWRAQLRTSPDPALKPSWPPGPGAAGPPAGDELLNPRPGSRLSARASLPVCPGRMSGEPARGDRGGVGAGRPQASLPRSEGPAGAARARPHQDGQEHREAQDPPEGHVVVAGPAPVGGAGSHPASPPPPDVMGLHSALGVGGEMVLKDPHPGAVLLSRPPPPPTTGAPPTAPQCCPGTPHRRSPGCRAQKG